MSNQSVTRDQEQRAASIDPKWRGLYQVGGAAALICAVMYVITLIVYVPANLASPPPETVLEWFNVFQDSPITGLFYLGLAHGDTVSTRKHEFRGSREENRQNAARAALEWLKEYLESPDS